MENPHSHLHLDATTRRNLELLQHPEGRDEHTLASIMDSTSTPMGGRLLRRWIAEPIRDRKRLQSRHQSIGALLETRLYDDLRRLLRSIGDIERILYNQKNLEENINNFKEDTARLMILSNRLR